MTMINQYIADGTFVDEFEHDLSVDLEDDNYGGLHMVSWDLWVKFCKDFKRWIDAGAIESVNLDNANPFSRREGLCNNFSVWFMNQSGIEFSVPRGVYTSHADFTTRMVKHNIYIEYAGVISEHCLQRAFVDAVMPFTTSTEYRLEREGGTAHMNRHRVEYIQGIVQNAT